MAGKSVESKREEFRRYLESTGVMDALTKALVALYEEPNKPENALAFILTQLGGGAGGGERVGELEAENAKLKEQIVSLGGTVEESGHPSPDAAAAAGAAMGAEPPPEGEPPAEGEPPPEGEPPAEGEPPPEGEPPAEGEPPPEGEPPAEEAPPEEPPAEEAPAEEPPPEG